MKKLLSILLVVLSLFLLVSCKNKPIVIKESDEKVIINVQTEESGLTLAAYMNTLEEYQDMFVIENGMVVSINGIENPADWSYCWMIYTDDESVTSDYYSVEYDGKRYNSSNFGAEKLIVKDGYTYIWLYQAF